MMKKVGLILIGTLFVVACGQTPYTSSPSPTALVESPLSSSGRTVSPRPLRRRCLHKVNRE